MDLQYEGRWSPSQQHRPMNDQSPIRDYLDSQTNKYSQIAGRPKYESEVNSKMTSFGDKNVSDYESGITQNGFLNRPLPYNSTNSYRNAAVKNSSATKRPSVIKYEEVHRHESTTISEQQQEQQPHSKQLSQNRFNVVSDNRSNLSSKSSVPKLKHNNSSRGIRVVSRNSSCERTSNNTSMEKKSLESYDPTINNLADKSYQRLAANQKSNPADICSLNCTANNPFVSARNEVTVMPHLNSLQTLQTENDEAAQKQSSNKRVSQTANDFYQNKIDAGFRGFKGSSINEIYELVRQQMEQEIANAKRFAEKKFENELQTMSVFYSGQIETLQKVLGENQTLIDSQTERILKLEEKCLKKELRMEKYEERFKSIRRYVEQSDTFTHARVQQIQTKFSILVSRMQDYHRDENTEKFNERFEYLRSLFMSVISTSVVKYRAIEFEIKDKVKEMMKKYDYFEEKVYEMDLQKNVGKENQIQNFRIKQQIEDLKQKLSFVQVKNSATGEDSIQGSRAELSSNQLSIFSQTIAELKEKITNLQKRKENYGDFRTSRAEQTNIQIAQQKLKQQIEELKSQLSVLEKKNGNHQQQILKLHGKVQELSNEREIIHEKYNEEVEKTKALERENEHKTSISQEMIELRLMVDDSKKIIQKLREELGSEVKEKEQLTEALEMSEQLFDEQIAKFKESIKELQQENQDLLKQVDRLQSQIDQMERSSIQSKNSDIQNYGTNDSSPNVITKCRSPKRESFNKGGKAQYFEKSQRSSEGQQKQTPRDRLKLQNSTSEGMDKRFETIKFSDVRQLLKNTPEGRSSAYSSHNYNLSSSRDSKYEQPPQKVQQMQQPQSSQWVQEPEDETSIAQHFGQCPNSNPHYFAEKRRYSNQSFQASSQDPLKQYPSSKVLKLQRVLQEERLCLPVECKVGESKQLKYSHSNMYIVDENYNTFCLTETEIQEAVQRGYIIMNTAGKPGSSA